MGFLRLLESVRVPALDTLFSGITYFGDELAFLALALLLFWCVDKRTGYYVFVVGLFGTLANQFLKITCRIPRPWVLDPDFTIVEAARAAATRYSHPGTRRTPSEPSAPLRCRRNSAGCGGRASRFCCWCRFRGCIWASTRRWTWASRF